MAKLQRGQDQTINANQSVFAQFDRDRELLVKPQRTAQGRLVAAGLNLGGLAGADAHCQKLATSASAGNRTWRAYLSTGRTSKTPVVNARDRIGKGPWFNAKGVLIARDVEQLHGTINLTRVTALDEKGAMVAATRRTSTIS